MNSGVRASEAILEAVQVRQKLSHVANSYRTLETRCRDITIGIKSEMSHRFCEM
jgi:hypothetical protein